MIARASCSWMRRIRTVPVLMFMATVLKAEPVQAQLRGIGVGAGRPSVAAEVVPGSLARHADALSLRISVEVPREHHGYLDKGDDGFFIPFSFSFPDLEGTEVEAEMTSRPSGTRDDRVRAQVLRGQAEFGFRFVPVPGPGTEATASLRYQICSDVTQRCYPPARLAIPVVLSPP